MDKISIICKKCNKKRVINREEYNELTDTILVCEYCHYILLPRRYAGMKPKEVV